MTVSLSSIAESGLRAASTSLEVSANNVANALTDDFAPSTATTSEAPSGGVRVSISQEARAGGTNLVHEMVGQMNAVALYRANLKSLQAMDDTTGVLVTLGGRRQE